MSNTPLTLYKKYKSDCVARDVGFTWERWHSQRRGWLEEKKELRNYIFATDTRTTSNSALPWKNKTTLPKLCQIRDNLHSNYLSALFPNDEWLKWEGYSQDDATKEKRRAIQAYMGNKCRIGGFREVTSQLLYDFIDYGMAVSMADFEANQREDALGRTVIGYIGPKARRISPLDIVFNPLAPSFEESPKIIRSLLTYGEIASMADTQPDNGYLKTALKNREKLKTNIAGYAFQENEKWEGFQMDGFGSYEEYLASGYVELLYYYGDIWDEDKGELKKGRRIVVMDRMWTIEDEVIPQWLGNSPIYMAGWRKRPDNLYPMGPLDNLVGMQYRIDHLENAKADATDLAVMPPLVIAGEVEDFIYAPGEEIHIDEGGTVTELARNVQWVIQADNAISLLEQRMEMYAGAPREAMGIRTAGEKTAFEVQQLQNAAGRIFQEKITTFEIEMMEKLLNAMLETSARNMTSSDVIRTIDEDLGAEAFMTITKEDIVANGVLRPIGARHFAAQAQLMQNLTGVYNSMIGEMIKPHTSTIKMAALVEDILGLERYGLYRPNAGVVEAAETQSMINQASEDLEVQQQAPVV
ncbi:MAG: portal protein [Podoviridae sp. ctbj_2]|nr:MAG: portal protein [Podoviridae sp. ctbj_2]